MSKQHYDGTMLYSIAFKDLSFKPSLAQVIYVEHRYFEKENEFIRNNYEALRQLFEQRQMEFVYMPLYFNSEETLARLQYNVPYLVSKLNEKQIFRSDFLLNYMVRPESKTKIGPSLLFCPNEIGEEWWFKGLFLDEFIENEVELSELSNVVCSLFTDVFSDFASKAEEHRAHLLEDNLDGIRFRSGDHGIDLAKHMLLDNLDEVEEILLNLRNSVRSLRLHGIGLGAIHEYIDEQEPLSTLLITEDLRLFLPEYNNIEIVLSPQAKALYFLFLNHPEGIVLQHLDEYHHELRNYYRQCSKGKMNLRMENSLKRWYEYGNNQLNVVIARIHEAFCMKFDERLAFYYYINGIRGHEYKIHLNPSLVIWED